MCAGISPGVCTGWFIWCSDHKSQWADLPGKDRDGSGHLTHALIQEKQEPEYHEYLHVARVYSSERGEIRQQHLRDLFVKNLDHLPLDDKDQLISLLSERHDAFCLDDDERGETDLVQFTIATTD